MWCSRWGKSGDEEEGRKFCSFFPPSPCRNNSAEKLGAKAGSKSASEACCCLGLDPSYFCCDDVSPLYWVQLQRSSFFPWKNKRRILFIHDHRPNAEHLVRPGEGEREKSSASAAAAVKNCVGRQREQGERKRSRRPQRPISIHPFHPSEVSLLVHHPFLEGAAGISGVGGGGTISFSLSSEGEGGGGRR